uniref:HSF-type DNA-binding domain-containing protein n=1 Tax=Glossina pallidipes TaxID=7398 RepID=A0A1B0AHV9_GLOPL
MESLHITRQDIMNFPFPYKLWLVVHLDFCDFLRWNRDGTVILLELVGLEDYLNSTRSIFHIKNRSIFETHLKEFQFERLNMMPEAAEDVLLQYKNENFRRHRLDLVAKIRRSTYVFANKSTDVGGGVLSNDDVKKNKNAPHKPFDVVNTRAAERMKGDLCFKSHGGLSEIQKSRLRFQTILKFQYMTRKLQEKFQASNELTAQQHRIKAKLGRGKGSNVVNEEQVTQLPADLFENPHDSVLKLQNDFRPEYAGYYGNCSKELITRFFGDYLPTYDNYTPANEDCSMEAKKVEVESWTSNSNVLPPEREQLSQPQNEKYVVGLPLGMTSSSTPIGQRNLPTLNFSSGLEPIYEADEEQGNVNCIQEGVSVTQIHQSGMDIEVDVFMDEFLKFKGDSYRNLISRPIRDPETKSQDINYSNAVTEQAAAPAQRSEFPQMPAAAEMEITDQEDNKENEVNFRNFFSQYRASLNLLYENP